MKTHNYKQKILDEFGGDHKYKLNMMLYNLVEKCGGNPNKMEEIIENNPKLYELSQKAVAESEIKEYIDKDVYLTVQNVLNSFKKDYQKFELIIKVFKHFGGQFKLTDFPISYINMFLENAQLSKYGIQITEVNQIHYFSIK